MNLYTKTHFTEKIPTSKGRFLGLSKNQSTRNLEVGDYFCIIDNKEDLLVFIQKEWQKIWFLGIKKNIICYEIEYNVLTDYTNIIKSVGFDEPQVPKVKKIHIPDEVMLGFVNEQELADFKASGTEIISVTVVAKKN